MMQKRNPLVTVGIPTYNRPAGLERTLECIRQQSYTNLEIIVSDNCSTDVNVLPILKNTRQLTAGSEFMCKKKISVLFPILNFY